MVRSFVALLIPEAWAAHLAAIEGELAAKTTGLSWVKRENLHITLRFLGDLGESGAERAGRAVARAVTDRTAFRARLGGVGAFPNFDRPRVFWAGLEEGAEEAIALARAVNAELGRDGFGRPDKPFRPHITLARVRERAQGLDQLRTGAPTSAPEEAFLDRVALMKSDLHPAGARYTALLEVRLRPPGHD